MSTDWTSPPGDTILDLLGEGGCTQEMFSDWMRWWGDWSPEQVQDLLSGKTPIDDNIAKILNAFLGGTVDFWITREAQYRAELQRRGI